MYRLAQCSNCPHQYHVDVRQLARGASRWACPICAAVTEFAEQQMQKRELSAAEAKEGWALIGTGALVIGLLMFFDRVQKRFA